MQKGTYEATQCTRVLIANSSGGAREGWVVGYEMVGRMYAIIRFADGTTTLRTPQFVAVPGGGTLYDVKGAGPDRKVATTSLMAG